jgi:hypothetical protein
MVLIHSGPTAHLSAMCAALDLIRLPLPRSLIRIEAVATAVSVFIFATNMPPLCLSIVNALIVERSIPLGHNLTIILIFRIYPQIKIFTVDRPSFFKPFVQIFERVHLFIRIGKSGIWNGSFVRLTRLSTLFSPSSPDDGPRNKLIGQSHYFFDLIATARLSRDKCLKIDNSFEDIIGIQIEVVRA